MSQDIQTMKGNSLMRCQLFGKILEMHVTNTVMLVAKKNLRRFFVVGKVVRCCQRLPFPTSRREAHPISATDYELDAERLGTTSDKCERKHSRTI